MGDFAVEVAKYGLWARVLGCFGLVNLALPPTVRGWEAWRKGAEVWGVVDFGEKGGSQSHRFKACVALRKEPGYLIPPKRESKL